MQLQVNEVAIPERIEFNYEELKKELVERCGMYETMAYTDAQIKEAKADKAMLNKLKKALNDERIRREREYMAPFNAFKAQVNELIALIDRPIALIDDRVKGFEEQKKAEKKAWIEDLFGQKKKPEWLKLDQIASPKWMNASYTQKAIEEEIDAALYKIDADMALLEKIPKYGFEALEVYKRTLNYNQAWSESFRLADLEKRKAEAEAAKKAEAERAAAEAAKRENPQEAQGVPQTVEAQPQEQPPMMWVTFRALLTVPQAMELKQFFETRNITFEAVR